MHGVQQFMLCFGLIVDILLAGCLVDVGLKLVNDRMCIYMFITSISQFLVMHVLLVLCTLPFGSLMLTNSNGLQVYPPL